MKCLYWGDVGYKNFCILCGVSMHSDLKQNTNLIKVGLTTCMLHTHVRAHTKTSERLMQDYLLERENYIV